MLALPVFGARAEGVLFREEFKSLANWKPLYFPKIKKHTTYSIVPGEGKDVLKAESDASASAIVYKSSFNVYKHPNMRWRWKADNVYKKGDGGESKAGDDYPIRVYVIFKYDPDRAGFGERAKYKILKLIYGEYPPKSSLNYVWASRDNARKVFPSPYTDKSRMIIKSGPAEVGHWKAEEVNILNDYRAAFGEEPPVEASLAIMHDSDNTGERSVSYVDFIEVY
jgi:hypothetical protein